MDENITKEIARDVLGHFVVEGGCSPGGFTSALRIGVGKADTMNRELLALGFPGYVAAMDLAQKEDTGIEQLQALVGVRSND